MLDFSLITLRRPELWSWILWYQSSLPVIYYVTSAAVQTIKFYSWGHICDNKSSSIIWMTSAYYSIASYYSINLHVIKMCLVAMKSFGLRLHLYSIIIYENWIFYFPYMYELSLEATSMTTKAVHILPWQEPNIPQPLVFLQISYIWCCLSMYHKGDCVVPFCKLWEIQCCPLQNRLLI